MKITEIQTGELSLPLRRPFKTALRMVHRLESVLVRVETEEGAVGYGEAPPTAVITGETKASIRCAVDAYIKPALIGLDLEDMDTVQRRLHGCMAHNTSAKAAVDMALYDLLAQRYNVPLWKLLGGRQTVVQTDVTISVNSAEEMAQDSVAAVADGFSILKLKVGKGDADDLARVRAVRAAVGPAVTLRVDANQGWTPRQAVAVIGAMEDAGLDIELIEQPVTASDLNGLRYVTTRVRTPILADEAVFSPADAVRILETGAADLINIKLMKTGGIWQALKICAIAETYGAECMIGCMLESKLAVSAAAHLAAARSVITRADLDGPALCAVDPYGGGPDFIGGEIRFGDAPGLGVTSVPCERWE